MSDAELANQQLVDCLIAEGALWSPSAIAAFRATPRHRFLDRVFLFQARNDRWREVLTRDPGPEEVRIAYSDRALITHLSPEQPGQPAVPISSSSQPSLMAQMLEDLHLEPGLRVLEVGAGTGYNAALLAHIVGPGRVTTIDVDRNVLSEAWEHLRAFPDRQVRLEHADGRLGFPAAAPFDRIMATAATPDLEPAWLEQLEPGGLLSAPLVLAPGLAFVVRGTVRDGVFEGGLLRAAYFMPLRAEGETGAEHDDRGLGGAAQRMAAPWGDWFARRRSRSAWQKFSQSLAFHAWLHGHRISYRVQGESHAIFGIQDADAQGLCWFGQRDWEVNGDVGQALGWAAWDAFRHAGGPWPTEFRLRARPGRGLPLRGAREEFVRQGPRCEQVWELFEPRDRA